MNIDLTARTNVREYNGKKYPSVSTFMAINTFERGEGGSNRTTIMLTPDDWYRWMATIAEILHNVKTIYVDNRISEDVKEDDYKIVNYKGEVLQMVPLMAKKDDMYIPAVRIIFNDESRFVDFPLIDIRGMYNICNKIDVFSAGLMAGTLGELQR
jgi:hypothetical protein